MAWIKWWLVALGALLLGAVLLTAWGAARWAEATRLLEAQLEAARKGPVPARYDPRELEGLPPPVQNYFRRVLTPGQPMVSAVTLAHRGSFDMAETGEQWKPFRSTQRVVAQRPGFVWDGRITMLPGLNVHVHDAYVAGTGLLRPAIVGLFTLAELRGVRELDEGELMRFFAEAAWYPTALLPSQGVRWQAVDGRTARATLGDGPLSVTLTFGFADDDSMAWVRAEARGRTVGGRSVPTPWEGRWFDLQQQDGMRVPMRGEVAWLLPAGRKPYWRGTVSLLRYEFAP
jgi:hypothetical protein